MDLRLLIVFSIILLGRGTLVKSSNFRLNLRESNNSYPIQVNSSTQGCGQDEKAGMLIGNVFIIYSVLQGRVSECSTVSTPTMANLSNTNERRLVKYIRHTCNGLRSCHLEKYYLQLTKQCGNFCDCQATYYDIYYSCHPVVPDTKTIFDMFKDFDTTFDTHTAALNVYLVLQRQDISYERTCCIEANNISINVRLMSTPSAFTVRYNGAIEILDDRYYNLSKRFYGVDKLCFTKEAYTEPVWFHLTDASANQVFTITCRGEKKNIHTTYKPPLRENAAMIIFIIFCAAMIPVTIVGGALSIFLFCRPSCQNVVPQKYPNISQLRTEYVNIDLNGEVDETGVDKITDRNVVSETKPNYKGYSSEYDVYNVIQTTDLSDKPAAEDMVGQSSNPSETYATICKRPADNEINVPGSPCRVIGQVGESTSCDVYSTPNKVKKNKDVEAPPTRVNQYSHLSHLRQGQDDLSNTYDG